VPAELPRLLALLPSSQSSNLCIERSARKLGSCKKYIERQKDRDDEVRNVDDLAYAVEATASERGKPRNPIRGDFNGVGRKRALFTRKCFPCLEWSSRPKSAEKPKRLPGPLSPHGARKGMCTRREERWVEGLSESMCRRIGSM
jgi:hypothetical protein